MGEELGGHHDLEQAVAWHQRGELTQAESLYRKVLHQHPQHPEALRLLGVLLQQTGHLEAAVALLNQALAVRPGWTEAHVNLGQGLMALERWPEAEYHWHQACQSRPDWAEAHFFHGNTLVHLGRLTAAVHCYSQAVHLAPHWAEAYYNLGNTWISLNQFAEAESCYRQAVTLRPDFAAAWCNHGQVLNQLGRLQEALSCFQTVLTLEAENAVGWNGLGNVLLDMGQLEQAIAAYHRAATVSPHFAEACYNLGRALVMNDNPAAALPWYRSALASRPEFVQAHYNLGNALAALDELEASEMAYRQALHYQNDFVDAWYNLGNTLREMGRMDEAMAAYDQALNHRPHFPEALFGKGVLYLLAGDLTRGWPLYECRWQKQDFPHHGHSQPLWDGRPLPPQAFLLIHCEQGFGDSIQFIRFIPDAKKKSGARIVLLCPDPLRRLFATFQAVDLLVTSSQELPWCLCQIPLMSLPHTLGPPSSLIPHQDPYLSIPPPESARFHHLLPDSPRFRVGLVWRGSPTHKNDRHRSMAPRFLEGLFDIPGVQYFSLQLEPPREDWDLGHPPRPLFDCRPLVTDFADTAAIITHLNLVISVDTSVIHLTGALGCRAWLLLPHVPDWRWQRLGETSPWYPNLRLFRQTRRGDWQEVMAKVKHELQLLLLSPPPQDHPPTSDPETRHSGTKYAFTK
ncbi:MAG: tetratricopeptide repeat protein [Magnetococcales bacterium]|nr:tetratricopeptide repeat protein [Magnetococcales bacterium]